MLAHYKKIAGVLAGLVLPLLTTASELNDIQFAELPGERVEIRLTFDEPPASPNGYMIDQPARIVLDFADVENALKQKKFSMAIGNISSAVVVSGGNRTRLIVNLDSPSPYQTRQEGNTYVVEVGGSSDAEAEVASAAATGPKVGNSQPVQATAAKKNRFDRAKSTIQDIDFRRGDEGEGKVIVQLSNPNINIDVQEVAGGIEVGFMQTELPGELNRKLDVTDFATPVKMVGTATDKLRSVIKIQATGEYDYLAYQANNEYVISVKPLTRAEVEEKKSKFAYTGEKLSLNFQNIEVRSVLQLIADFTDLNLVASDTVTGSITLRLDNVPWDQALELVLKTKGLDKRQVGNVLLVAPAAEIAERERQELATKKQLQELAPLRTEYIRVRYANARELFELFIPKQGGGGSGGSGGNGRSSGSTGSILSERGQAIVDERTNSIILTDTEEKILDFRRVIEQIDIPIRQVMIEARIVTANTNFRRELGTRLQANSRDSSNNRTVGADALANVGIFNPPAGALGWSIISENIFLDLELQALENSGYAEIVSQPKVITGDKQQATIEQGTEIPYREASASGAATVSFKEAVLKLDVTPQITPDDHIIMDLKINQDNVGDIIDSIPLIDVTQLVTQVLVADGQTIVLGGIFQIEQVNNQRKVPLLGDIPVLGRLFRSESKEEEKRELLIFITPRIMANNLSR